MSDARIGVCHARPHDRPGRALAARGPFWTPGLPGGAEQAQFGNAIKPEWNDLTDVTVRTVPPGTTVYSGPAAPQTLGPALPTAPGRPVPDYQGPGVLGGGDAQVFLPELPLSWGVGPRG